MQRLAIKYPASVNPTISKPYRILLDHLSIVLDDIKIEVDAARHMNEKLFYAYNPVLAKPIIRVGDHLTCPLPLLLFQQIGNYPFYQLKGGNGFDNGLGKSFQDYCCYIIDKIISKKNTTLRHPEMEYVKKKNKRASADSIVEQEKAVLFIECKAKRMTIVSKSSLNIEEYHADLDKMAEAIVQAYLTFIDYKDGFYGELPFISTKKHFILILTLEEWFLFNHHLQGEVWKMVHLKMEEKKIDTRIIEEAPYAIQSIDEFELDFQLACRMGFENYFPGVINRSITEGENEVVHKARGSFMFMEDELIMDDLKRDILDRIRLP